MSTGEAIEADPTIASWAEYRMICADGAARHDIFPPSRRDKALEAVDRRNEEPCGPHSLQQRLVERTDHPWGDLLQTDPQTTAKEALLRSAATVACPKCRAGEGESCFDLRVWKASKEKQATGWPHAERITSLLDVL